MKQAEGSTQAALELAREELAKLEEEVREPASEAYAAGDKKAFERLDRQLKQLEALQEDFEKLMRRWRTLGRGRTGKVAGRQREAKPPRPRRGDLLPEREHVFPMLEALKAAGGSAKMQDVIRAVGHAFRGKLSASDRNKLEGGQPRWANRLQWVRQYMVHAGLLASDSPRGTWTITEEGLRELEAGDLERTWALVAEAHKHSGRR